MAGGKVRGHHRDRGRAEEVRGVGEHRCLQRDEVRARAHPELLVEYPPGPGEGLQRRGLPTCPVEPKGELGPQPFPEWVLQHQRLDQPTPPAPAGRDRAWPALAVPRCRPGRRPAGFAQGRATACPAARRTRVPASGQGHVRPAAAHGRPPLPAGRRAHRPIPGRRRGSPPPDHGRATGSRRPRSPAPATRPAASGWAPAPAATGRSTCPTLPRLVAVAGRPTRRR